MYLSLSLYIYIYIYKYAATGVVELKLLRLRNSEETAKCKAVRRDLEHRSGGISAPAVLRPTGT